MKKLILSAILMASAIIVNAQTTDTTAIKSGRNGNNEIKLNLAYTIAGIPEINYERILKDDMSVGLAVMVGLEDDADFSFAIIPNYRIYFGNKKANGFFIEGNASVLNTRDYDYYYLSSSYYNGTYQQRKERNITSFGLGAAAGGKFLTRNGFLGEAYLGVGRSFGRNSNNNEAYPRVGITIGKRF